MTRAFQARYLKYDFVTLAGSGSQAELEAANEEPHWLRSIQIDSLFVGRGQVSHEEVYVLTAYTCPRGHSESVITRLILAQPLTPFALC